MSSISFVIPVYNEEKRLAKAIKALHELQLPRGLTLQEVIFVDDGSTDNTEYVIWRNKKQLERSLGVPLTIVSYRRNRGKGHAVRQGMLDATGDYTLFFDVDMSTPLSELQKFMKSINARTDVIIGTRKNGKSIVTRHQPFYRELLGKGFIFLTKHILGTQISDVTCGFKAFSRLAKNEVFGRSFINGWGYDAEIVYLAQKLTFPIDEIPVTWAHDDASRVRIYRDVFTSLKELLLIRLHHTARFAIPNILFSPAISNK